MLDVVVYKAGPRSLGYRPFIKRTVRHLYLSPSSCHPWPIHRNWPIAEICRMHNRWCTFRHFLDFKQRKVARFEECLLDPHVIELCRKWQPQVALTHSQLSRRFPQQSGASIRTVMVVLPYNEFSAGFIRSLINQWNQQWSGSFLRGHGKIILKLVWSNGGQPLKSRLLCIGKQF